MLEKGGVSIFSGKAERSGSYRLETPGSNPIQGYNFFLFSYFLCYHKSWDTVSKIYDNSQFKANYQFKIIANSWARTCWHGRYGLSDF